MPINIHVVNQQEGTPSSRMSSLKAYKSQAEQMLRGPSNEGSLSNHSKQKHHKTYLSKNSQLTFGEGEDMLKKEIAETSIIKN